MDEQDKKNVEEENEKPVNQEDNAAAEEKPIAEETMEGTASTQEQPPEKEKAPEPTPEEAALAKAAAAEEKYLRLMAEFDNYRKRMAREATETRERARISVIGDFLPVYDFFQMAMAHSAQNPDINVLKQGMEMILREFSKTFDTLGLKEIPAVGQAFDPHIHEAARSEASDTVPEGKIISQWKAGYKIGENLVRPSMVVVSSGPAKKEEEAPVAEKSEEAKDVKRQEAASPAAPQEQSASQD